MKNKRLYLNGATVPTDYDIESDKWVLMTICIPNSVTWRAVYRGLIVAPTRYWFWRLDGPLAHDSVKLAKEVLESVNMICTDELNYNLREINFTLKHLLTQFGSDKSVKFFIDKPAAPAIDPTTGEWDLTDNNEITINRGSVLQTEQYIDPLGIVTQKFSLADIMATALVEGAIVIDPIGQSLFSIKSKFDQIRTDINYTSVHFLGGFTDLMNWFAETFRESPYVSNNPLNQNTFYNIFTSTFNKTTTQSIQTALPNWVGAWLPDFIFNSRFLTTDVLSVDKSYIKQANDNFATTFNETNTDGVASNSYFRYLHTWLGTDWKLFHDLMGTMRDCICEAKSWLEQINIALWGDDSTNGLTHIKNSLNTINGSIAGLELNPTINVDACCEDLVDATNGISDSIKDLIDATKDNGSTTTDNGDGTYTTTPNDPPTTPLDPDNPTGDDTTTPYKPVTIKKSNGLNALCGFTYYMFDSFASFLEYLFAFLDPFSYLYALFSRYKATKMIVASVEMLGAVAPGGVRLAKIGTSKAMSVVSGYFLIQVAMDIIPSIIRGIGEEFACGLNGKEPIATKQDFINSIIQASIVVSPQSEVVNYIGFLAGIFWDYSGANDASSAVIDMNAYAQYCPCPIIGDWEGTWYRVSDDHTWTIYMTGEFSFEGEREWGPGGGRYHATITGAIDINNPLLAAIQHVEDSHEGFPSHHVEYSSNAALQNGNTEINNNGSIFVRT